MLDFFRTKLEELEESIQHGMEALAENESQYRSEISAYGDAGPGQWHTIQSIQSYLDKEIQQLKNMKKNPKYKLICDLREKEYKSRINEMM
jgi:hypothetical protein